jgi:hypothetical protein
MLEVVLHEILEKKLVSSLEVTSDGGGYVWGVGGEVIL